MRELTVGRCGPGVESTIVALSICVPGKGEEITGRCVADVMDGDVIALNTAATLDACRHVVDCDVV